MATIPGWVNEIREKTPLRRRRSAKVQSLSPVAALLRRHDRDRFQTALFAPAAHREALFALYAFNYEIARVRESVTQPTLGRIRLEWWRENIAAAFDRRAPPRHPVAEALSVAILGNEFTRAHFERLIEAREADFDGDPPMDLTALEAYAEGSSSRLVYLALEALRADDEPAVAVGRHVGIAYALTGLLRALPMRAAAGRPTIPADVTARHGLAAVNAGPMRAGPELRAAVAEIMALAAAHLRQARAGRHAVRPAALPALLPAVIAARWLRQLERAGYNPFNATAMERDPLQSWRLAAARLTKRF